jgi:ATP-dependent RNA helicase RhlE
LDKAGIHSKAIHGNKSQGARTKALEGFKKGTVRVLVATDIAARGLDIPLLPHVINYELPNIPEDYVHRIGRTGRAGAGGEAISIVSVDEFEYQKGIEKLLGRTLESKVIPGFEVTETLQEVNDKKLANKTQHQRGRRNSRDGGNSTSKNAKNGNRSRRRRR